MTYNHILLPVMESLFCFFYCTILLIERRLEQIAQFNTRIECLDSDEKSYPSSNIDIFKIIRRKHISRS